MPRTQETVQAASSITRLTQLGSTNALTAEQSEEIKANLKQIVAQGAPAVAAIRDFLQKDLDIPFGKQNQPVAANAASSPPSVRMALIESLGQIGGPEAISVAGELLQRTLAPSEIGLLAKTLEQLAPGDYRDAAVNASREALAAAAKNPVNNEQQVAGLFQILSTYGGPSVIGDLESLSGQWRYYGLMAIAGMPESQGVSTLIDMATKPGAQATGYQQIALQMLAQLAPSNESARNALLEQTKNGQVSNWPEVANTLSGARLQYGFDQLGYEKETNPGRITQTHHVVYGNQSFHTVNTELSQNQMEQNRSLVDQLMNLTTDSVAREALQRAKDTLSQTK